MSIKGIKKMNINARYIIIFQESDNATWLWMPHIHTHPSSYNLHACTCVNIKRNPKQLTNLPKQILKQERTSESAWPGDRDEFGDLCP